MFGEAAFMAPTVESLVYTGVPWEDEPHRSLIPRARPGAAACVQRAPSHANLKATEVSQALSRSRGRGTEEGRSAPGWREVRKGFNRAVMLELSLECGEAGTSQYQAWGVSNPGQTLTHILWRILSLKVHRERGKTSGKAVRLRFHRRLGWCQGWPPAHGELRSVHSAAR